MSSTVITTITSYGSYASEYYVGRAKAVGRHYLAMISPHRVCNVDTPVERVSRDRTLASGNPHALIDLVTSDL